jgi:hypothetical protein
MSRIVIVKHLYSLVNSESPLWLTHAILAMLRLRGCRASNHEDEKYVVINHKAYNSCESVELYGDSHRI